MTARTELLAIQRDTVARLKREIEDVLVRERPAIRRYYDEYCQEFDGSFAKTTRDALAAKASLADLVYVGDYHTLEAAQRTFLWLVESVHARRGAVAIALEMFEPMDQPALDAFLAGALAEEAFLVQIRYAERWGFPWEHYRPILDFARRTKTPVYGFDRRPGSRRATLAVRDRFAGSVIARIVAARPGVPVLVLAGDLHLARAHLPSRVDARLEALGVARRSRVLVFQSSEVLYWKLARLRREQTTEVVRLDAERFGIMVATPLAKVRSYLDWARNAGDDPILPALGSAAVDEDEERAAEVFALLADFFRVPLPPEPTLPPSPPGDEVLDAIGTADGLLARTALDRVAEGATRSLRAELAGAEPSSDLYAIAVEEALAFLGSLVVNHARAHRTENDYRLFLERTRGRRLLGAPAHARATARHVIRHAAAEALWASSADASRRPPSFPSMERAGTLVRSAVGRALGQRLGALLYRGLIESRFSKARLRALLLDTGDPRATYFELVRELRRVSERLARTARLLREPRRPGRRTA